MNVNLLLGKINPVLTLDGRSKQILKDFQNICHDVNMLDNQSSCDTNYRLCS
jgi:hypothetical protein